MKTKNGLLFVCVLSFVGLTACSDKLKEENETLKKELAAAQCQICTAILAKHPDEDLPLEKGNNVRAKCNTKDLAKEWCAEPK